VSTRLFSKLLPVFDKLRRTRQQLMRRGVRCGLRLQLPGWKPLRSLYTDPNSNYYTDRHVYGYANDHTDTNAYVHANDHGDADDNTDIHTYCDSDLNADEDGREHGLLSMYGLLLRSGRWRLRRVRRRLWRVLYRSDVCGFHTDPHRDTNEHQHADDDTLLYTDPHTHSDEHCDSKQHRNR
jgi:hypothetical protein